MRHLGITRRVLVHSVDTQPLRHIDRQILCHHQTITVLEEKKVEKARVTHDTGRVACLASYNVRSAFRVVSICKGHGLFPNHRRSIKYTALLQ